MPDKSPANPEKEPLKQPEIEVVSEEHKPEEVEVHLEPKVETPAPDPTEKLKNQLFYEQRQLEKRLQAQQQKMMDELAARISGTSAQPKGAEKLDDFDEEVERVAQTDWRKAVDMRAERKANELYEKKMKEQEEQRKMLEAKQVALRVESKGREKVLAEFPDILDESTPEFRAYMEIYNREVNDDPMFMYNPRKHELILPELREKMGTRKQDVNPELQRLTRVAAGSAVPSRQTSESNKVMLTQEEIQMCKRSGIPVESYARTKKLGASGLKEGVVVDE